MSEIFLESLAPLSIDTSVVVIGIDIVIGIGSFDFSVVSVEFGSSVREGDTDETRRAHITAETLIRLLILFDCTIVFRSSQGNFFLSC